MFSNVFAPIRTPAGVPSGFTPKYTVPPCELASATSVLMPSSSSARDVLNSTVWPSPPGGVNHSIAIVLRVSRWPTLLEARRLGVGGGLSCIERTLPPQRERSAGLAVRLE